MASRLLGSDCLLFFIMKSMKAMQVLAQHHSMMRSISNDELWVVEMSIQNVKQLTVLVQDKLKSAAVASRVMQSSKDVCNSDRCLFHV